MDVNLSSGGFCSFDFLVSAGGGRNHIAISYVSVRNAPSASGHGSRRKPPIGMIFPFTNRVCLDTLFSPMAICQKRSRALSTCGQVAYLFVSSFLHQARGLHAHLQVRERTKAED